ncbi:MAG TPA: hypothetical protein VG722_06180 [Tepidisphaeraceae bacterium]|nr:hypothetical protein [Tepidisphaeraceae bacterium]
MLKVRSIVILLSSLLCAGAALAANGPYEIAGTFHIGGSGGWDYVTVDSPHHLIYVTRSTHTDVIDADTGKLVADISGQERSHGVALVHTVNRGFITDGGAGDVLIFDLKTDQALGKIKTPPDSDGAIYDPASNKVLIVSGDAGQLIPISPNVDPANGRADKAIDLGGKPEFLAADGHGKAFVCLADKDEVAVVDTKHMKLLARWPTAPGGHPTGMAIDAEHERLFVGCRKPEKMIVMDANNGKVLASLPIGGGNDAVQFDNGNAFASCRDGTLTVVHEETPNQFKLLQVLKTAPGARTMGVDSLTHALYLPTAEFESSPMSKHARMKPDSFKILLVK